MREHESHRCMREHERHRECDKIRCSEAVDVGNNETHHCLSLGARSVDRRRRTLEVGVAAIQRHAPRFKRHQQRPHRCVDSKHDDNKQTALANSSNKVNATHTRRRLAHERRSQIARINTALSNYFSVLRAIHLHSTQKLSFQSWLNASERLQSPMRNICCGI
jgi:hypothetical protein